MIALVEQLGFRPVVTAQFVQACPDVIDGIAAQVAAVGHPADQLVAFGGSPAACDLAGRLKRVWESRPSLAGSDLRSQVPMRWGRRGCRP
jgi:hypothetical protein